MSLDCCCTASICINNLSILYYIFLSGIYAFNEHSALKYWSIENTAGWWICEKTLACFLFIYYKFRQCPLSSFIQRAIGNQHVNDIGEG